MLARFNGIMTDDPPGPYRLPTSLFESRRDKTEDMQKAEVFVRRKRTEDSRQRVEDISVSFEKIPLEAAIDIGLAE